MTTVPTFESVDNYTSDLLDLIANTEPATPGPEAEWRLMLDAMRQVAAAHDGLIYPNELRPLVADKVAPQRRGAFTHRALRAGIVERTGEWQTSDDTHGRNSGRPVPVMRWLGTD